MDVDSAFYSTCLPASLRGSLEVVCLPTRAPALASCGKLGHVLCLSASVFHVKNIDANRTFLREVQ